jgi:hypothetical protein
MTPHQRLCPIVGKSFRSYKAETHEQHRRKGSLDPSPIYCNFSLRIEMDGILVLQYNLRGIQRLQRAYQQCQQLPWLAPGVNKPITAPRMPQVWKDHLPDHFWFCHLVLILFMCHHKFESPEPVRWHPESSAHGRSLRVTQEPELLGEEQIVYLPGRVSQFP